MTLDRKTVVVDVFDEDESIAWKMDYIKRTGIQVDTNSPGLRDDARTVKHFKTAAFKAAARGWGEVMFKDCYGPVLNRMETMMNAMFSQGKLSPDWKSVVWVNPKQFGAVTDGLQPITEDDLRKISEGCFFPVHVCGYNWLQSVHLSGQDVAKRIDAIMNDYQSKGSRCEKVILVTHSCGGLVARALCHPEMSNFENKVLGVIHGVQPAMGAAAAYYRMLGGWEKGNGLTGWALGDDGPEVMVMLGNGPGGLQLLPFKEYGAGWLQVVDAKGKVLRSLPEKDPYTEIYLKSSHEVWWGLLRPEWLNPAKLDEEDAGLNATRKLITEEVKPVQEKISTYYHPVSYAHYGVDPNQKSFINVVWKLTEITDLSNPYHLKGADLLAEKDVSPKQLDSFPLTGGLVSGKKIILKDTTFVYSVKKQKNPRVLTDGAKYVWASLLDPVDPGDKTVPAHSARHQHLSRQPAFKGVFEQSGYEHQESYTNRNVQDATLYSIVQIAKTMKWDK